MRHEEPPIVQAAKAISVPEIAVVEDLARYLHCAPSTVRGLLRSGEIPGRKIGRRWIIERQALLRALARTHAHPQQATAYLRVLPKPETSDE